MEAAEVGGMKASDICAKAAELVGGERGRQHGTKERNFESIAALWNGYMMIRPKDDQGLAHPFSAADVGHMMVLLKIARTQHGAHNLDDYIDMAGYAGCAGEIAEGAQ